MVATAVIQVKTVFSNFFIIPTEDGTFILVDALIPNKLSQIKEALEKYSYRIENASAIVVTHAHVDHAGSVKEVAEVSNADIIAHANDVEYYKRGVMPPQSLRKRSFLARVFSPVLGLFMGTTYPGFVPDVVFDRHPMNLGEYDAHNCELVHTPGHTSGSLGILWKDPVNDENSCFIAGDTIGFAYLSSAPNKPLVYESHDEIKKSIKKILDMAPKTVYVGHYGPYTLKEIADLYNTL